MGRKGSLATTDMSGEEATQAKGVEIDESKYTNRKARAAQMGNKGYKEMGRKGGLATTDMSGEEATQAKGVEIDESKYMK
ncbi:hypothetical protein L7F22_064886 [Adiantum nelumboides]|nr:hypothetical protein [Adiantum nelumboides]